MSKTAEITESYTRYQNLSLASDALERAYRIDDARTLKDSIHRILGCMAGSHGPMVNTTSYNYEHVIESNTAFFNQNRDAVISEAIHDARAEGVQLNLPDSLSEIVVACSVRTQQ